MRNLFVTGTGTEVGKTYVTGLLAKALKDAGVDVGYFKAAMSGNERDEKGSLIPGDALTVKTMGGLSQDLASMCPYVYEIAVSPHLAGRLEGPEVDPEVVRKAYVEANRAHEMLLVEGSGGILCPLARGKHHLDLVDVARLVGRDVLIVADAGLGTLNALGLTLYYLEHEGFSPLGILLNNFNEESPLHRDNLEMIEEMTDVPVLATIARGAMDLHLSEEALARLTERNS